MSHVNNEEEIRKKRPPCQPLQLAFHQAHYTTTLKMFVMKLQMHPQDWEFLRSWSPSVS